jgi:hypothetical protein
MKVSLNYPLLFGGAVVAAAASQIKILKGEKWGHLNVQQRKHIKHLKLILDLV